MSKAEQGATAGGLAAAGGLWQDIGTTRPERGKEVLNAPLAAALRQRVQRGQPVCFSSAELDAFNVHELSYDSYIKVGNSWFQPAVVKADAGSLSGEHGAWHGAHGGLQDGESADTAAVARAHWDVDLSDMDQSGLWLSHIHDELKCT